MERFVRLEFIWPPTCTCMYDYRMNSILEYLEYLELIEGGEGGS